MSWNLARFALGHSLPLVCSGPVLTPSPGKGQNGCLSWMALYLLFPRALVFYLGLRPHIQGTSSGRIRRHQPSVRSERGLGDDSSGYLRSLPQVAVGAQQGSLPRALHTHEFSKAEGTHLFRSHTPISKIFVRRAPSVSLLIYVKPIVIRSCTDILGTL